MRQSFKILRFLIVGVSVLSDLLHKSSSKGRHCRGTQQTFRPIKFFMQRFMCTVSTSRVTMRATVWSRKLQLYWRYEPTICSLRK